MPAEDPLHCLFISTRCPIRLPSFTLVLTFAANGRIFGPEARPGRGKSIGGDGMSCGDPLGSPQNEAGERAPSHALRVTPLQRKNSAPAENTGCPPGPGNDICLMVFSRPGLASGPGTAGDSQVVIHTCRKVKGGKQTGKCGMRNAEWGMNASPPANCFPLLFFQFRNPQSEVRIRKFR